MLSSRCMTSRKTAGEFSVKLMERTTSAGLLLQMSSTSVRAYTCGGLGASSTRGAVIAVCARMRARLCKTMRQAHAQAHARGTPMRARLSEVCTLARAGQNGRGRVRGNARARRKHGYSVGPRAPGRPAGPAAPASRNSWVHRSRARRRASPGSACLLFDRGGPSSFGCRRGAASHASRGV